MYVYQPLDQAIVDARVEQFRDQCTRYINGELSDEEFLPLRLQNGLYIQRLAPMLRICVPYGMLSSRQLRALAAICRKYDKGYAHISTRQNVQINWPRLEDVPDILAELAAVQMHAIQTSGNCIRNFTTDQFAGVAADEQIDPRPWCELLRQWATLHPEFAFLPRKFKIALDGAESDRAAIMFHDIGLRLCRNDMGEAGVRVFVGGGLGRTPMIGSCIREFLPLRHLVSYLEAILRIYNLHGRRDNKYKARIKILVKAMGADAFAQAVEAEWQQTKDGPAMLADDALEPFVKHFQPMPHAELDGAAEQRKLDAAAAGERAFGRWLERNTHAHRVPGYRAVTLSFKPPGVPPGDVTAEQLDAIADLAERYSFAEARTTHEQNMVLADVPCAQLHSLWGELRAQGLASPTVGTLSDIICCPGGDFCSLANAKSIPVAEAIQRRFEDLDYLYDLGDLDLNISGCMNACGHHHIGHIGILGVDKKGEEWYQIQVGGNSGAAGGPAVGRVLGPAFARDDVPGAVERLLDTYLELRQDGESFLQAYQRIGFDTFKERTYAQ